MLQSLYLRDFVIVDQTEIEFADGFCALSGETGAGKSILLDALGLALGSRADAGMVRAGARRTEISACFEPTPPVSDWLDTHELANEDQRELLMRRVIGADGRSKAFINGTPVKLAQLRELGSQVLEIHGQHASQSLLRQDGQRNLLDNFASLEPALALLRVAWREWQSARKTLAEATGHTARIQAEREQIEWQLGEIDALQLLDGEWESLNEEQRRLAHASSLIEAAQTSMQAISDGDQAMHDQLVKLISRMRSGAELDDKLTGPLEMLESARIQLNEAASDLGAYVDRVDDNPQRLADVEERISAVFSLARKLGLEPQDLPDRAQSLTQRLAELDRARDLQALQAQVQSLQTEYDQQAGQVHAIREKSARLLTRRVSEHLQGLGMSLAKFDIALRAGDPGPTGTDSVEFQFAGHESLPMQALAKVASGGELSRVSLAIAVSAAQANPVPTLIFDEADAGVGGSVADAIGQLMRQLGQSRQVMAVTHLPQVAAQAHHQFVVSKTTSGDQVSSSVQQLGDKARIDEIARMLGGARVTRTTREHARELLALATDSGQPASKPAKKTKSKTSPKKKTSQKTSRSSA